MGWLFKKKREGFDEIARVLAQQRRNANTELETKRKELELERLQAKHDLEMVRIRAEIAEYEDDDDGFADIEGHLKSLIEKSMMKKSPTQTIQTPIVQPLAPASGVSFSDDQIRVMVKNLNPIQKAFAKRSSDETITSYIRERVPDIDDDSINRAIFMIREDL